MTVTLPPSPEPGPGPDAADGRGGSALPASIVLVGMMGSGKTSVGDELAARLGWELLDSDREIEALTGSTVAQIFAASGEAVFRGLESKVLAAALARPGPFVVAAGGGVVLDAGNRHLLNRHDPVVWLRAHVDTLIKRVGDGNGRPLLGHDVDEVMRRLDAARRSLYEDVADVIIDVDQPPGSPPTPRQIAAQIAELVLASVPGSPAADEAAGGR